MPVTSLLRLADERFVSLTTFRRSGQPVSTPVWVGRDGDALVVLTPSGSGKVKRLRADPRVEVQACGRCARHDGHDAWRCHSSASHSRHRCTCGSSQLTSAQASRRR